MSKVTMVELKTGKPDILANNDNVPISRLV
jgi:hypothetical protein